MFEEYVQPSPILAPSELQRGKFFHAESADPVGLALSRPFQASFCSQSRSVFRDLPARVTFADRVHGSGCDWLNPRRHRPAHNVSSRSVIRPFLGTGG